MHLMPFGLNLLDRATQRLYKVLETVGFETGAFSQLTRRYMLESFNAATPDVDGVKYVVHLPRCVHS